MRQAPGIPCALFFWANEFAKLGCMRRENAGAYLVVIVREGGRSSIPETPMIESIGRSVLDTPHARGMTVFSRWRFAYVDAPSTQNNSQQIAPASEWRLRLPPSALMLANALLNRRP